MANVVPTASGGMALPALPTYLVVKTDGSNNSLIKSGLGSGFVAPPQINIRGGKFRMKIDGEETMLAKKDEDGETVPVGFLNVVVLAANTGKHKTYYMKKYDEAADPGPPDCYSYDGDKPSIYASSPQSQTCGACPKNVFGSAISEKGNKVKACGDSKILAVMAAEGVKSHAADDTMAGTIFQLRVSATALNRNREDRKDNPANNTSLLEYVSLLDNYPAGNQTVSVPVQAVVTRLFLDKHADYPLLRFRLGGFLTEADVAYVTERAGGDDVTAIITDQGSGPASAAEEPFETPKLAVVPAAPVAQPAPVAAPSGNGVDDDDKPAPPPPKRTRGPAKPAAPAPAAAAAKTIEEPVIQTTGKGIDKELEEIGALFK